jgi:hypothetical protein
VIGIGKDPVPGELVVIRVDTQFDGMPTLPRGEKPWLICSLVIILLILPQRAATEGLLKASDARTSYARRRSVFQSCAFAHDSKS